jgi:phage terminase large subunit GpA-like protein
MPAPELGGAAATIHPAAARALRPDPIRSCWEWADQCRILPPESGSPVPGPYRTELVPYLREPMEVMSLAHPAERVTFKKSAQVGASDAALNLLGQIMSETPAPTLVVTPSIQVASDYNKLKLDPMIRASPVLRDRVDEINSRDADASTATFKRFAGGFLQVVGANASKALQMRSARVVVFEELSEFPTDTDGRGAPEDQALERTQAWSERGIKVIDCSTPGEKTGNEKTSCRVTTLYERSSRGRYFVRCPLCDEEQTLSFERLHFKDEAPDEAVYLCENGCPIEHRFKRAMVAAGRWIHEFPDRVLKHAGYAINALYSPFISWGRIAHRIIDARGDTRKEKVLSQQVKGEAWEDRRDLPSETVLLARREMWPAPVPPEVLFLEAATDVQSDRLESAVWGFDRNLAQFLIEKIITPGKPTDPSTWRAHDELLAMTWRSAWGREMHPLSWGIDTGYATNHVYSYVRRHSGRTDPRVFALDGQGAPRLPPLGSPTKRDIALDGRKIGIVLLWPVGTFDLKVDLADLLRGTEQGPDESGVWPLNCMRLPITTTADDVAQLTAEVLEDILNRQGQVTGRRWRKLRANELWDLAVYARALAYHNSAGMTEARWSALEAEVRTPVEPQADLSLLWTPTMQAGAARTPEPAVGPELPRQAAGDDPPAARPQGAARKLYFNRPRAGYFGGRGRDGDDRR